MFVVACEAGAHEKSGGWCSREIRALVLQHTASRSNGPGVPPAPARRTSQTRRLGQLLNARVPAFKPLLPPPLQAEPLLGTGAREDRPSPSRTHTDTGTATCSDRQMHARVIPRPCQHGPPPSPDTHTQASLPSADRRLQPEPERAGGWGREGRSRDGGRPEPRAGPSQGSSSQQGGLA